MTLASTILITVLMSTTTPVEPGLSCPNQKTGIERFIRAKMTGSRRYRKTQPSQLAERIVIEAKRFKLDPLVMTTIAWIESSFNRKTRGKYGGPDNWQNEAGVWQLIQSDAPVRSAARAIIGCKPTGYALRFYGAGWRSRYGKSACSYPDIAKRRRRTGYFKRPELIDLHISTWIAAYEIRQHIDSCRKRKPNGHRWYKPWWWKKWQKANPKVNVTALERYLHFNWGSRQLPRNRYRRLLFSRYSKVRRAVCVPVKRTS
jgi:hypothetical protein